MVLNIGEDNLQSEESFSPVRSLVAKNGGKRGEAKGEKPGKGPSHFVLLFGNELWLNPGRRQTVYKEPGITLSLFRALQFRSEGPQPAL